MKAPDCGHGVAKELPAYRGVRVWRMNCGEVACELSASDFFNPVYLHEWIDAALAGETDGWHGLNLKRLAAIRHQGSTATKGRGIQ
jgi:hypothetical protein